MAAQNHPHNAYPEPQELHDLATLKPDAISPHLMPATRTTLDRFATTAQHLAIENHLTVYPERNVDIYKRSFYPLLINEHEFVYSKAEQEQFIQQYAMEEPAARARLAMVDRVAITPPDPTKKNQSFVFYDINGGLEPNKPVGRLYFNFQPSSHMTGFEDLVQELAAAGVSCTTKTLAGDKTNQSSCSRTDKVVLYFTSNNQATLLSTVRAFYTQHQDNFFDATPAFTAPLITAEGASMRGIAFGEEPDQTKWAHQMYRHLLAGPKEDDPGAASFSSVRLSVLLEAYQRLTHAPIAVLETQGISTLEDAFTYQCLTFGINPLYPAFNIDSHFQSMLHEVRT